MKQTIPKGIALTMLILVMSVGAADAKPTRAKDPAKNVDPVQTQNQRHKTQHADRKTAAKHLRVKRQQEHQAELLNHAHQHQGYSGRGRAGLPTSGGAR